MAQSCDRLAKFVPEFVEIMTTDILEFDVLEILPDALNRIEIGRIAWQSQDLEVRGRTLRQERFHLAIDEAAVRAALSLPFSNGATEGQINRLKCLKQQMFGRAKLDLLPQRLLAA